MNHSIPGVLGALFISTAVLFSGGCSQEQSTQGSADSEGKEPAEQESSAVPGQSDSSTAVPAAQRMAEMVPAVPAVPSQRGTPMTTDGRPSNGASAAMAAIPMTLPGVAPDATKQMLEIMRRHLVAMAESTDRESVCAAIHADIDRMYEQYRDSSEYPSTASYIIERKIRFHAYEVRNDVPGAREKIDACVASMISSEPESDATATAVGARLYYLEIDEQMPSTEKEQAIEEYLKSYGKKSYGSQLVYLYGAILSRNAGPEARLNWFERQVDVLDEAQARNIRRELTRSSLIGQVPEFSGPQVNGNEFNLTELRGKVVLVDFWATWCVPCIAELPEVKKAYEEFHDQGFEVVAFSLDREREPLTRFLEKHDYDWIQVYIEDETLRGKVTERFGVTGIPASYLIDQSGKIAAVNLRGHEQLKSAIERLLQTDAGGQTEREE